METAFHVLESYHASAFITLFVFNNQKWAIEDNLVADTELEHMLFNTQFYDTLGAHPAVQITNSLAELHACLAELSAQQNDYAMGKAGPQMKIVVVRGLDAEVPVLLGDIDPIRKSPEMELMKKALGAFAALDSVVAHGHVEAPGSAGHSAGAEGERRGVAVSTAAAAVAFAGRGGGR